MVNFTDFSKVNLQLNAMSSCVYVKKKYFQAKEHIESFGFRKQVLGVVIDGEAEIMRTDIDGNLTKVKHLVAGSVFNDAFSCNSLDSYYVVSKTKSEIAFIEYPFVFSSCPIHCPFHNQMVTLILNLFTQNTILLNEKIEILSHSSIRERILCFLNIKMMGQDSSFYKLPFSFSELAKYLCVDRSAMMREIKKMERENILFHEGRNIYLKSKTN